MTDGRANDNDLPQPRAVPDAHGQAAMLLVESLVHGLIARSVLSVADAVEIVGIAAEVKAEIATDLGDTPATMRKSLIILETIAASLRNDLPRKSAADEPDGDGLNPHA